MHASCYHPVPPLPPQLKILYETLVFIQAHAVKLYKNLSYIPHATAAIALNYRIKNIWKDVRQILITHHMKQSQFNSLAHARPNNFWTYH